MYKKQTFQNLKVQSFVRRKREYELWRYRLVSKLNKFSIGTTFVAIILKQKLKIKRIATEVEKSVKRSLIMLFIHFNCSNRKGPLVTQVRCRPKICNGGLLRCLQCRFKLAVNSYYIYWEERWADYYYAGIQSPGRGHCVVFLDKTLYPLRASPHLGV